MPDHSPALGEPRLELPALPPVIFGTPLLIAIALHWLLELPRPALERATAWAAGGLLVLLGLGLAAWAIRTFTTHGENPHPPSPTKRIVESGPYRFSRNPMYLAMALVAIGIGVGLRSWVALASVPVSLAAIHHLVIRREEAYLDTVIGEAYRAYRGRVRRYL